MRSCRALYRAWNAVPKVIATDIVVEPKKVWNLAVTSFNTQLCELRGLYRLSEPEATTPAMARGHEIHAALEEQALEKALKVSGGVRISLASAERVGPEEVYAAKLLDMVWKLQLVAQRHPVRELRVVAMVGDSIILTGVIDEIDFDDGKPVICDTKTSVHGPPAPWKLRMAYHQLLIYHRMIQQLASEPFDNAALYRADSRVAKELDPIFSAEGYDTLLDVYAAVEAAVDLAQPVLAELRDIVRVDFIMQKPNSRELYEYKVDPETSKELFDFRTSFFEDHRPALAVDPRDGYCRFCQFQADCPVYNQAPSI